MCANFNFPLNLTPYGKHLWEVLQKENKKGPMLEDSLKLYLTVRDAIRGPEPALRHIHPDTREELVFHDIKHNRYFAAQNLLEDDLHTYKERISVKNNVRELLERHQEFGMIQDDYVEIALFMRYQKAIAEKLGHHTLIVPHLQKTGSIAQPEIRLLTTSIELPPNIQPLDYEHSIIQL